MAPQRRRAAGRAAALAALAACLSLASPPLVSGSWPIGGSPQTHRLRCDEEADEGKEACTTRVTVIGAGLAGLTSARALKDLWARTSTSLGGDGGRGELNLTILEARDTVGGRAASLRINNAADEGTDTDAYSDLLNRALWIHDTNNAVDGAHPVLEIAELLYPTEAERSDKLRDVDLLSEDNLVRACSADSSSMPCTEIDAGDSTRSVFRASRQCLQLLLQAAQERRASAQDSPTTGASLQDAIDEVKGEEPGLTVTDELGGTHECANAEGDFAALLEHGIATDIERLYGGNTAELDAKWYNYRLFDGEVFPPLLADTVNSHKLIKEGYDQIVDSIFRGTIMLSIPGTCTCICPNDPTNRPTVQASTYDECMTAENCTTICEVEDGEVDSTWTTSFSWISNYTQPEWTFASGNNDTLDVELDSPVTKITRICEEREAHSRCVAAEYVVERENGYSTRADVVIMAVPLGVLQQGSIELLDATSCTDWASQSCTANDLMSVSKRDSIAGSGFGNINKLVLHYDSPCTVLPDGCEDPVPGFHLESPDSVNPGWIPSWEEVRVYGLARPGDYARGFFTQWFDLTSVVGHPVLVAYGTGLAADVVETAPTSTIMMAVNATLTRIFGGYASPVRDPEISKWGSDNWEPGRYAQGAMPHWKPGNTFSTWDDVAAPIDNSMFFTGDYGVGCSNYPGYRDKDGDSCEEYDQQSYCTPMGAWDVQKTSFLGSPRDVAVDGVSPFEACCACGGGIKDFGSMSSALGTTHGAMKAGRKTALDVIRARDKVVLPTGGGDRPRYDCKDETDPVLPAYVWKDPRVVGSCDWFRANPWACKVGTQLLAATAEEVASSGEPVDWSTIGVDANALSGRGPRDKCPVACGTCRRRACDSFPCKNGAVCEDKESHPGEFTDEDDYRCECGLSGYTGQDCDVDYRECDEIPCRDPNGLADGICYDSVSSPWPLCAVNGFAVSRQGTPVQPVCGLCLTMQHTNEENRVPDHCNAAGYPYPENSTCASFVPVGYYKCICKMGYDVDPGGTILLENGYEVSDFRMTMHQTSAVTPR